MFHFNFAIMKVDISTVKCYLHAMSDIIHCVQGVGKICFESINIAVLK